MTTQNANTIRTINLDRFQNSVGFIPQFALGWSNTRKANIAKVTLEMENGAQTVDGATQANLPGELAEAVNAQERKAKEEKARSRMQLKKQLIVSKEYEAIKSYLNEIRAWIYNNTVPSFFTERFQLVALSGVERIEKYMRAALAPADSVAADKVNLAKLVDVFIKVYPQQIEDARKVLEPAGQFNIEDYPTPEAMRALLSNAIRWNWISFTVPEGLPEELKATEKEKMEKQFSDAGEQIKTALRVAFAELINHAKERLSSEPGAEKAKVFRDSMVGNITDFIETFNNRNLLGDVELARLVTQANELLTGVTPQKLRTAGDVKENVAKGFAAIATELDKLVVEKPGRMFDLGDDDEQAAA